MLTIYWPFDILREGGGGGDFVVMGREFDDEKE